jgi:hypothetical protein
MIDPFVQSDPPLLVHELDGLDFQNLWNRATAGEEPVTCPLCGHPGVAQHGISPHNERPWIRFACGDVVAQEVTAG